MSKKFNKIKDKFESKKNIVRVQKNKDNPYVMINKQGLNDPRISWAAKGLLSYLLSLPDDWEIFANELVKHTSSGRDHTYTVINELLKNGYMEKTQYRCEGKVLGLNYMVFEVSTEKDNSKAKIINVTLDDNGEIVEMSTLQPNTETTNTVMQDTDSTTLLNNDFNNNNFNNNDLVDVVVDEKETKLLELYKSFKLEKRAMPHTTRLLKENLHIDLEVFEEIFIAASEDDVKKKFAYIRTIVNALNRANIKTLSEFNALNEKFKESKENKSKGSYTPKVKTRFHNITQNCMKYSPKELEKILIESQKDKFKETKDKAAVANPEISVGKHCYESAIRNNWDVASFTYKHAKQYCIDNNLEYPNMEF